jgi:RNA polymerase sigma factor (sigma-70 family)
MPAERQQPVLKFIRKLTAAQRVATGTDAQLLNRFIVQRDEAAFAALVERHGPLVFGVCRRVLQDTHHAEDAYQATFLVFAQKASSVRYPETLGNWLYGVAYRTALKAKATARGQAQEPHEVVTPNEREPVDELIVKETRLLLDEEINRLPVKYCVPLVLCYLAGRTHKEAAEALGCPRKTITTRLLRAREHLRRRLVLNQAKSPAVGGEIS